MKRLQAYIAIGICYIVASLLGVGLFLLLFKDGDTVIKTLLSLFAADVLATLVVWLFGLCFKNSSFYDPYWSLMPWLILLFAMLRLQLFSVTNIILLVVIGIWSFRLTINYCITCYSLKTEDWRYKQYRAENGKVMWHIINLFGINMMPTILVFAGLTPALLLMTENLPYNPAVLVGAAVVILGTVLELFSDIAMHKFKASKKTEGQVLNNGLWKYSRHPNYLGEITVWLGIYLMAVLCVPKLYFTAFGFIAIFSLFWFISIPLMEKRQIKRRPKYADYIKTTSRLFILPPKIQNEETQETVQEEIEA